MTPAATRTARAGPALRSDHERGSGSVLVAGSAVLLVVATAVAVCVVGWLGSVRRAADVADLAALAGARAQLLSGDACAVARSTVRANGALTTSCSLDATAVDFVVEVTVSVEVAPSPRIGDAPRTVVRTARAGPLGGR